MPQQIDVATNWRAVCVCCGRSISPEPRHEAVHGWFLYLYEATVGLPSRIPKPTLAQVDLDSGETWEAREKYSLAFFVYRRATVMHRSRRVSLLALLPIVAFLIGTAGCGKGDDQDVELLNVSYRGRLERAVAPSIAAVFLDHRVCRPQGQPQEHS